MIVHHVALVLLTAIVVQGGNYTLCREYAGNKFFESFYWWSSPDPTQGRVK